MSTLKVGTIQDHTNSNTALSIDSSGLVTAPVGIVPKACAFSMHATSAQSLAGVTEITYEWDASAFDTNGITDLPNNRVVITAATAGLWFLSFTSRINNSVPFRHINYIKVNGSVAIMQEQTMYSQTTGASSSCTAAGLQQLSDGDIIIARIYHGHSTKNTEYGYSQARLEGFRIGTV